MNTYKKIYDIFGEEILIGSVLLYVSCKKKNSNGDFNYGVVQDQFDNGNGWKIRIRTPHPNNNWLSTNLKNGYADNALIRNNAVARGCIVIKDPINHALKEVRDSAKLRNSLISLKKIKIPEPEVSPDTIEPVSIPVEENGKVVSKIIDVGDLLSNLGAPRSLNND